MGTAEQGAQDVPVLLRQALLDCAAAGRTGTLRVAGRPGGTVHFSDGRVIAAETPGAPGVEVILFRSGRVDELGWDAAFAAAAANGREMRNELIGRELAGAGELEALSRLAIADAVFAMAYGIVEGCEAEAAATVPMVTLEPGYEAEWLLAETARRIRSLSPLAGPAGRPQERVTTVPGPTAAGQPQGRVSMVPGAAGAGLPLGGGRDELAALADGRRTPRDLAFALGRGLYATMLELERMQADGLIVTHHGPAAPTGAAATGRPGASAAGTGAAESLPRRRRDNAGTRDTGTRDTGTRDTGTRVGAAARAGARELPAAFRLLRLRYSESTPSEGNG